MIINYCRCCTIFRFFFILAIIFITISILLWIIFTPLFNAILISVSLFLIY
ncbi:unnamed protein product [Brugia timori]|uniref:Uncharacterized protein n=1 Tax=Brugia timori TaxID=42155 RepID=A0A0R3RC46_9BILA|nr:unnamed protein product [Brugia timori]